MTSTAGNGVPSTTGVSVRPVRRSGHHSLAGIVLRIPSLKEEEAKKKIMEIVEGKEKEYKDWFDKNKDPYGRAVFTFGEAWGWCNGRKDG